MLIKLTLFLTANLSDLAFYICFNGNNIDFDYVENNDFLTCFKKKL